MPNTKDETYRISSYVFIKFLAIVYIIAFLSLLVQVTALIGADGILPAHDYLNTAKLHLESSAYYRLPTLCWFSTSDAFLQLLCYLGALLGVLLFFEYYPIPILFSMWIIYLSLTVVGQVFFEFQWDNLLLEVGFLSIFLVPFIKRINAPFNTSKVIIFLFKLLLFKLIFMSGLMKLLSGDETWRNLTALAFHYETQPLPNPIAYRFNMLPESLHIFGVVLMFAIELFAPFFIFMEKRFRALAFFSFLSLQLLILITGNYCFFNLLTILLSLFLIDDSTWGKLMPRYMPGKEKAKPGYIIWHRAFTTPLAVVIVLVSLIQILRFETRYLPSVIYKAYDYIAPFRSINTYGLFSVMTKKRTEIILEGSEDGSDWKAYEFYYKPGRINKRLPIVAPHQPRLDWQMWFTALSPYDENRWFIIFCQKILQGNTLVLSLLEENPFPNKPPKYLRAVSYDYQFTNLGELRSTGNRWKREYIGLYAPVFIFSK